MTLTILIVGIGQNIFYPTRLIKYFRQRNILQWIAIKTVMCQIAICESQKQA